jgi:probable F420-dependent oxidoreductase
MKIGIAVPTVINAPVDVGVVAQKAESLGFESIWAPEHPIVPVHSESRFPGSPDGVVPQSYSHMMDPFIALARASALTKTLMLGTGICLVPERNPLVLGKVIATLDHYSGGRFLFGIGAGWLKEETEIMGGNFIHRWSQTRESVLAMKELWTKRESEYHGKYYDFPPVRSFPKPAQKPHPPVLLGGKAENVFRRVVAWGDGWMPNRITPEQVKAGRATLDELAMVAGRDPKSIEVSVFGLPPDKALIDSFGEAGAVRTILRLEGESTEEAAAQLEEMAQVVLVS